MIHAVKWVARQADGGGWYISNHVTDNANVILREGHPKAYLQIKSKRSHQVEEYNLIVKVIPITCNITIHCRRYHSA